MVKTSSILHQQYNNFSNPSSKIARLVKSGELTPIIRGLYETDSSVPGHYLSRIIYGPSYLSFEYALAWHDLIPEAVYVYTSATCGKNRRKRYDTPFGIYTYCDIPMDAFPYGINLYEENGYGFVIASAEKAVCDILYTCSPCANRRELRQLIFDDLRIDENAFRNLDLEKMVELAGLYRSTNHKLLISMINGGK